MMQPLEWVRNKSNILDSLPLYYYSVGSHRTNFKINERCELKRKVIKKEK